MGGHRRRRRLLQHHEADPQPPVRIKWRWWSAGRRRTCRLRTDPASERGRACGRTFVRTTWSSCTTPRPPGSRTRCAHPPLRSSGVATSGATPRTADAAGWEFLRPYIEDVDAFVFTRSEFAPEWIDQNARPRHHSVDRPVLCEERRRSHPRPPRQSCSTSGSWAERAAPRPRPSVVETARPATSPGAVDILQTGPPALPEAPLVVQLSRWDRIKDMQGVLEAFADACRRHLRCSSRARRPRRARRDRRP